MAETTVQTTRQRLEEFLRIDPRSKPRLYAAISEAAEVASLNYWLELFFSAGIATLGLVLNSPAVVIGAMLISPLMGPILAAGLSLAVGDLYLGIKSAVNLVTSILAAVMFSALIVWMLPFHSATNEILARTSPNLLDLGVAVFSGLAGSVVVFRGGGGGGVTALPGVAIAVALMPPLCTVGFGVGSGFLWPIIYGAGLLFLTNLAAIVASAFAVFLAVKMDAADVREEIDDAIRERASRDRLFRWLRRSFLRGSLADIGKLRWRVLMLTLVLGVLFVPLSKSLIELRNESLARGAVRDAIRGVASRDAIVSEIIDLSGEQIRIRLILTESADPQRVEDARSLILKRTGRDVDLFVRKVAG
nr:TIGR00341 family protein [Bryobacterales bacterium]